MCLVARNKLYFCLLKEIRHKSSDYPHRVAKYPENRNRNRYRDVSPCKYLFSIYSSTFSSLFATEACEISFSTVFSSETLIQYPYENTHEQKMSDR